MTVEEFDQVVVEAKRMKRIVRESLIAGRERLTTESDLTTWEQDHQIALPASYRHFAKVYGCGHFVFTTVLSVLPDSDFPIAASLSHVGPGLLPVVDNHCGDYYCLPVEGGRCIDRIVFADHEVEYKVTEDLENDLLQFIAEYGLKC